MTTPSIPSSSSRKQILSLAWPVILNNLLLTFVWIVDMMMVGRLGSQAVAAVGVSGQMFNMVMVISKVKAIMLPWHRQYMYIGKQMMGNILDGDHCFMGSHIT